MLRISTAGKFGNAEVLPSPPKKVAIRAPYNNGSLSPNIPNPQTASQSVHPFLRSRPRYICNNRPHFIIINNNNNNNNHDNVYGAVIMTKVIAIAIKLFSHGRLYIHLYSHKLQLQKQEI